MLELSLLDPLHLLDKGLGGTLKGVHALISGVVHPMHSPCTKAEVCTTRMAHRGRSAQAFTMLLTDSPVQQRICALSSGSHDPAADGFAKLPHNDPAAAVHGDCYFFFLPAAAICCGGMPINGDCVSCRVVPPATRGLIGDQSCHSIPRPLCLDTQK
ncbi:hypothetical protein BDW66DRAFT_134582 [Aspergillus desertorum]